MKGLGGSPIAIGGIEDHVHLLVGLKSTHCLADFVRDLKKSSSVWERDEQAFRDFAWQVGYGAFTVGVKAFPSLTSYIRNQPEHHLGVDSKQQLLDLCRDSQIEVDMRYFE